MKELGWIDLSGGAFLTLYGTALIVLIVVTVFRRMRAYRAFQRDDADTADLDHYEMAMLAAGAGRCQQLALLTLAHEGAVRFQKRTFGATRIIAVDPPPDGLCQLEKRLWEKIRTAGRAKGVKTSALGEVASDLSQSSEASLAMKGLRPTAAEKQSVQTRLMGPFFIFAAVGLSRLFMGLLHDEYVGFTLALLIVGVILGAIIVSTSAHLTPAGKRRLKKLRTGRSILLAGQSPNAVGYASFALIGAPALKECEAFHGLDATALSELEELSRTVATVTGGGDSGCSSGCGGGGGGCGGCGGCG